MGGYRTSTSQYIHSRTAWRVARIVTLELTKRVRQVLDDCRRLDQTHDALQAELAPGPSARAPRTGAPCAFLSESSRAEREWPSGKTQHELDLLGRERVRAPVKGEALNIDLLDSRPTMLLYTQCRYAKTLTSRYTKAEEQRRATQGDRYPAAHNRGGR